MTIPLDATWLAANPLPDHGEGTDKNSRGRVLAIGGSALVPGAIGLTAEAAFRAGAGKVRIATIADAALPIGVRMPEAAVVALPMSDGEIAESACATLLRESARADCIILGPAIGDRDRAAAIGAALLREPRADLSIVLDAASVACAGCQADLIRGHDGRIVMTPHHGEMAACIACEEDEVAKDPERTAREAAERFGAVIVLKSGSTIIAAPGKDPVRYAGGGVGLATGGSGDVLAGVIGGLLSRGAAPLVAACWGVWLHGEAGAALAGKVGRIGFLARELPAEVPGLMARR